MVFAGERYYAIYRVLLTILGLWPYQKPWPFQRAFFICAFISLTVFQLTTFLTRTCDLEFVIRILSYVCPSVVHFALYNLFYFNTDLIKQLLEEVKVDWNGIQGNDEMKIMEKYASECHLLTLFLTAFGLIYIIGLPILECMPIILDVVAPLNESRPRKLKIDFELFIDEKQYFHIYLIHEFVVMAVMSLTVLSTGTMLLAFLRHCCATYAIASNLLEAVVTNEKLSVCREVRIMYQTINRAVHIHRKSVQFSKQLMETLNKWFFFLLGIGVLSLSCNLLRLLNALTLLKEITEVVMCTIVVGLHFIFMFLSNLMGQSIIDHSTEIFFAAYRTMWYLSPLPIQKLLLIIMQHTIKADTLLIGGIFVASLEGFSTLITTSLSYFTIICNIR